MDYDPGSALTQDFFATAQNKLHWAIFMATDAKAAEELSQEVKQLAAKSKQKE